jgi:hypothetical protein
MFDFLLPTYSSKTEDKATNSVLVGLNKAVREQKVFFAEISFQNL